MGGEEGRKVGTGVGREGRGEGEQERGQGGEGAKEISDLLQQKGMVDLSWPASQAGS